MAEQKLKFADYVMKTFAKAERTVAILVKTGSAGECHEFANTVCVPIWHSATERKVLTGKLLARVRVR